VKFEFGLDDRTVRTLDQLIHTLQQMLKPECRYFGPEDEAARGGPAGSPPAAPEPSAPPAKPKAAPKPAAPAEAKPAAPKPAPAASPDLNDIFGGPAPEPRARLVTDDEMRKAMLESALDNGIKLRLLKEKYKVATARELDPAKRADFVADLGKSTETIIAEMGVA
jgi:hypothetical protein